MKLTIKQKAILAICVVALAYSLLNVSIRLLSSGFDPLTQVYLRIGLGFLLTYALFYKQVSFSRIAKTTSKDWLFLILMGTFGYGIAVDLVTIGVLHTNLLNVAVIGSTTPFFVFLFNIVFMRKSFNKTLLFFLIVTFYGVCILATNSLVPSLNKFFIGDLYILFFAIGLGIYIIARKFLSNHLNNTEIAVIVMFIAFLCSLITALLFGQKLELDGFENPMALLGLAMGGVLNLVATKVENFGFQHLNAVTGSQLMLLENIFSPFLGFVLYKEIISFTEFFGALVVLVGVWSYIRYARE